MALRVAGAAAWKKQEHRGRQNAVGAAEEVSNRWEDVLKNTPAAARLARPKEQKTGLPWENQRAGAHRIVPLVVDYQEVSTAVTH